MKIEVKNVSKKFKNETVLKNVNLHFESNHIYGLNGKNGSGKTILLKMLCGLNYPTNGEITYDGKKIDENLYKYNYGALIEHPNFFNNLSGFENLKLLAEIKNIINEEDINRILDVVNLTSEKDKKFGKYSLGMKQKLGIAQAIMENQDIIYLDEPFNGIDTASVNKIKEFLKKEKKKGKIIVISSHNMDDLIELSDFIYYFEKGQVVVKKS